MARLKAGLLTAISGKIGPVVGSSWKGIEYIRTKGTRRKDTSVHLAANNTKFRLAHLFIKNMRPFLNIGYKDFAVKMTACNSAVSYIMKYAFTGTYEECKIDHSLVKVSRGGLPCAAGAVVAALPGGYAEFTWDEASIASGSAADCCMALLYSEPGNKAVYELNGSLRSTGRFVLDARYYAGNTFHAWLAFRSADGKHVSDSVYLGQVTVQ